MTRAEARTSDRGFCTAPPGSWHFRPGSREVSCYGGSREAVGRSQHDPGEDLEQTSKERTHTKEDDMKITTQLKAGTWEDGGITAEDDWETPVV